VVENQGLLELLSVPGLGARRAAVLVHELGVHKVDELDAACRDGRVAAVRGFGDRSAARIAAGIAFVRRSRGLRLLPVAVAAASRLDARLPRREGLLKVVGSVARWREVVRDLDLLYVGERPAAEVATMLDLRVEETMPDGALRLAGDALPVDLYAAPPARAVAARVLLTAAPGARHALLARAAAAGIDLAATAFRSEAALFEALGLPHVPPELLEDAWGIEAAERGALLDIVGPDDVRGSLHTHSRWSDGRSTIRELAARASELGHRFLGISDHSRSAHYAGGLKEPDLLRQRDEVARVAEAFPDLLLLHGIESDVLPDGSLDYPDETLAALDFVVASVHSRMEMPPAEMTARVLRAVAHPATGILAHPTGRLLLRREPHAADVEAVLAACAEHRVAVELNANPERLDLDWRYLRRAVELGVVVAISTDAHDAAGLSDLAYGAAVARKAALPKSLLLNAWPLDRMVAFLKRRA